MAYIQKLSVTATTDGSGDATVYSDVIPYGFIEQMRYAKTDFANGVDFTITLEGTGETVWTESDVNASATRAPRQATHTTAGVASVYASTDGVLDKIALANDRIKIVIGSGGATTTGTFHILIS